jgi:tetratricopeptide (TPR) repeat protein
VSKSSIQYLICGASLLAVLSAPLAQAQTNTRRAVAARPAPAAPVTLVRPDTDLFSATLAGRFAQGTDNPALAAQAWSRAFMRRPSDIELFSKALTASLQTGDVANAIRLSKTIAPNLRTDDAALVLAVDAFSNARYGDVGRFLSGRTFQPSQRIIVDHLNAYALLGQNKADDGVNLTSRSTGIGPLDKAALMSRAIILDQAGRSDEAIILFQSAIDGGIRWSVGVRAYGDLLLRNGRKSEALALYQRAARTGGNEAGGFLVAKERAENEAAPRKPSLRAAASAGLVTLAQSLAGEGRGGPPLASLNLVAFVDPSSDAPRLAIANQLIGESKSNLALPLLRQIGPSSADYFAARGELVWAVFETNKDEAISLARETRAALPNQAPATRLLADVLAANRNDPEAERLYTTLIEQGKTSGQANEVMWPLYFGRGGTRERQGNWPAARDDLRIAKTAAPNQPSVLNYLGYALADRGESLDEALTLLRAAVRLRPRSGSILDSLGWAQFKAGRYEEAVATLEKASSMESNLADISDHLGDAYWRSGREDEARIEWARTLRLETTQAQRDTIARKLQVGLPSDPNAAAQRAVVVQSSRTNPQ